MKGFIEVTPMCFEPDYKSDNPFDGEYVNKGTILINTKNIKFLEGNSIIVDIDNERIYSLFENYEEIKRLIKQAQS